MSRKYPLFKSFGFAFQGLFECARKEPNFRVHMIVAVLVFLLAGSLNVSTLEWIALVLTISFVLFAELINTSVESMINILSPERREEARISKDTASAAVLISALAALAVGIFIFLPKLF